MREDAFLACVTGRIAPLPVLWQRGGGTILLSDLPGEAGASSFASSRTRNVQTAHPAQHSPRRAVRLRVEVNGLRVAAERSNQRAVLAAGLPPDDAGHQRPR